MVADYLYNADAARANYDQLGHSHELTHEHKHKHKHEHTHEHTHGHTHGHTHTRTNNYVYNADAANEHQLGTKKKNGKRTAKKITTANQTLNLNRGAFSQPQTQTRNPGETKQVWRPSR